MRSVSENARICQSEPPTMIQEEEDEQDDDMDEDIAEVNKNKTGVINDPLSQTHNPASSDHNFHLRTVLFWEILTDGRHMCENSDHY